jgi:hypothetical protein
MIHKEGVRNTDWKFPHSVTMAPKFNYLLPLKDQEQVYLIISQ